MGTSVFMMVHIPNLWLYAMCAAPAFGVLHVIAVITAARGLNLDMNRRYALWSIDELIAIAIIILSPAIMPCIVPTVQTLTTWLLRITP